VAAEDGCDCEQGSLHVEAKWPRGITVIIYDPNSLSSWLDRGTRSCTEWTY
jgi:hypothetical protein